MLPRAWHLLLRPNSTYGNLADIYTPKALETSRRSFKTPLHRSCSHLEALLAPSVTGATFYLAYLFAANASLDEHSISHPYTSSVFETSLDQEFRLNSSAMLKRTWRKRDKSTRSHLTKQNCSINLPSEPREPLQSFAPQTEFSGPKQALHHECQPEQTLILAYLISSESRPPNIENTPSRIYGAGYTLLHDSQHFNSL
ncbi:hypothetical protein BKA64DRAFT_149064 [Cadophora sp. MPI-SDFR-AT-0126]|nr:hypothetical protein BKA64DRAFT_149064 [Leotiomycetes sp. MPI-SDFR-AT-0126]